MFLTPIVKPNVDFTRIWLQKFFLPEEEAYITLKISTSALRTINKKGIAACIKEARQKGFFKIKLLRNR